MRELHLLKPFSSSKILKSIPNLPGNPEPDILSLQKYILLLTLTFP